jgi:hypothetical protein
MSKGVLSPANFPIPTTSPSSFPLPPPKTPEPGWADKRLVERALFLFDNPKYPLIRTELEKYYNNSKDALEKANWVITDQNDYKKMAVVQFLNNSSKSVAGKRKTFRRKKNNKKSRTNRVL